MSNYIVLIKQVPDVTQITDNAFDPETGTLIRTRLASVINELDAQALAFAHKMRRDSADKHAKLVALTMGPPMAEEVLRYALSRCADTAVLLTDRNLGGADTVATANPLAFAIRRIVKEYFGGDNDYYIVSGMQSVDGDTAQVPPQIAQELDIPCVAYATDAEYDNGRFRFTRIISGGSQLVTPRKIPAIITVAKYEYPLFAAFSRTRWANKTQIVRWSAADINATHIGVKGSKTRVIRVFPPPKSTRQCRRLDDVKKLAQAITDSYKRDTAGPDSAEPGERKRYVLPRNRTDRLDRSFEGTGKESEDYAILCGTLRRLGITDPSHIDEYIKAKLLAEAEQHFHRMALEDMLAGLQLTEPSFSGEVWVVAEHNRQGIHPATFELIGKARDLADSLETKVGVCLAGYDVRSMVQELTAAGADNVYLVEDELLGQFDPAAYRKAVAGCIATYWPQIVLYAATPQGRMLAPMISYSLGCGLTADCTGLDIRDSSRKGQIAILLQTRPALGGNVMATICTKDSRSQMATARPGVMKRLPPDESRTGRIIEHKVDLTANDLSLEILGEQLGTGQVNFGAEIIVSGGRGLQSRDNYQRLLTALRDCLQKRFDTDVERAASRAAVEQGFIDRIHQVGQTGTTVSPKIYIALAISGAIQHMIGIANSQTIIAVNNDPGAPILKQCDYFLVGNVEDVIPELIRLLEND